MSKKKKKKKKVNKVKEEKNLQTTTGAEESEEAPQAKPEKTKKADKKVAQQETKQATAKEQASSKDADSTDSASSEESLGSDWLWAVGLVLFAGIIAIFSSQTVIHKANQIAEKIPLSYLYIIAILPIIVAVVICLVVSKLFYQISHRGLSLAKELTENDNPAAGLSLGGYLFGIGIALTGICYGILGNPKPEANVGAAVFSQFTITLLSCGFGLLISLPLMRLSAIINDKFILHKFSIAKEIYQDRNMGTGAICCGSFIATGLIIMGSFTGEGGDFSNLILSILLTFFLGQTIFVIGAYAFQKTVKYDFHYEVEEHDNPSAGIILGSFLVALGWIVSSSISGVDVAGSGTNSLIITLITCIVSGILGIIILLTMGLATAKMVFPRVSLDEEVQQKNPAVAFIIASVYLTMGLVTQALLQGIK